METIIRICRLIDKSQTILISTHEMPDADGIGSQIALCLALRSRGKKVFCVNDQKLMDRYLYLDPQNVVSSYQEYLKESPLGSQAIDLFIVVDANMAARVGNNLQGVLKSSKNFVFIDHHPCPKAIQAIHCIDTMAAATGELVGKIIMHMGITFTPEMALPLYTSILIDTSSFRYPTVSADTHRVLAHILDSGVRPAEAYNMIYGTKKLSHLRLLGSILSSVNSTKNEEVAWIVVRQETVEHFGSNAEDTLSFINHLLILDNVKVACMFRNIGKYVKIGLRSSGDIDVGELATALGGGGHNHSAASTVEGDLDTVVKETIKKLQTMLAKIKSGP